MEEKVREDVALFRYGLIAPLLHDSLGNQTNYLAKVCNQTYQVPHYGIMEYSPKTIRRWFQIYLKHGLEGLKPRWRSDKGKPRVMGMEARHKILELREGKTQVPVTVFHEKLITDGVLKPQEVSYSSVYRFLESHDLIGKRSRREPEGKRFAFDKVNALWQTDLSYGPYLKVGKKKVQTYLLAFIDDASRLVPYAGFFDDQSFNSLKAVSKEAVFRRGLPEKLYTDNGKIYRSDQLQFVCAALGIALIHAKPYDAAAKGKIERFF